MISLRKSLKGLIGYKITKEKFSMFKYFIIYFQFLNGLIEYEKKKKEKFCMFKYVITYFQSLNIV